MFWIGVIFLLHVLQSCFALFFSELITYISIYLLEYIG